MKKGSIGILMFLSLFTHQVISQGYFSFPDTNAAWNTVGDNVFTLEEWHFRYAVFGDTVINSVEYSKVYEMYDSTILHPNSSYFAAIRENEQRQVFCLIPGFPETMLYDFSLEIGDTIWQGIGGGLCYNEVEFWEENHFRVVTETDSILLENNQYRRSWVLSGALGYQTWVEGIGSIEWYGLFNPLITAIALCGDSYQFACFKHNDTVLYLDNPFCDHCFCQLFTDIEEQHMDLEDLLTLFPNPSNDKITIRFNELQTSTFTIIIYNPTGKKISEEALNGNQETEIALDQFESGLYTIQVFNKEGKKTGTKKFIVE